MARAFIAVAFFVASVAAQDFFECPLENGFFAHDTSCDKYWHCEDDVAELKVCSNGLAFDDTDPKMQRENCDYLYNVECGDRTVVEDPISTTHCPRLNGVFADEAKCDVFWSCWGGEASRYMCAPGLAYDEKSRVCIWADQVDRCTPEEVATGFVCPDASEVATGSFTRHAHPEDCRNYYVCMNNAAREYGCPIGSVFKIDEDNDNSGFCTSDVESVAGCEDYYAGIDIPLPVVTVRTVTKKAKSSRTIASRRPTPVFDAEEEELEAELEE